MNRLALAKLLLAIINRHKSMQGILWCYTLATTRPGLLPLDIYTISR